MTKVDAGGVAPDRRGFHAAAPDLLESGWLPMPLPPGRKDPPVDGLTGYNPTAAKAARAPLSWKPLILPYLQDDDYAAHNTAVRMRHDTFALDIDDYVTSSGRTKSGWANLEAFAEARGLGDPAESLPATLRLTARGFKGRSGQRFYRLPEGIDTEATMKALPSELVPGIEVLRPFHRYTIEAGSLHPDGFIYRVYDERRQGSKRSKPLKRGLASITPDDLPVIPEDWLRAILSVTPPRGDDSAPADDDARAAAREALEAWVAEHDDGTEDTDGPELLRRLSVGTRHAVLDLDSPQRHNANLPGACIALLRSLIEDVGRSGTAPLAATIDLARALYTRNGDRVRRPGEFDRTLAWAFPLAVQAVAQNSGAELVEWADQSAVDAFWGQSEVLRRCRDFARYRQVSPDAMLACALTIVASWLPPHLVLPALVGGKASLNFFVAIAQGSGGGKSAAMSAAKEWLNVIPHPDSNLETDTPLTTTVATGEGLLSAYTATLPRRGKGIRPGQVDYIQHRRSIRFEIDEIGALGAVMSREGSTLKDILKQMWTGSAPSMVAADTTRTRKLEDQSFRATVLAGVQPATADVILSGHGDGWPQRWLWVEVYDENPLTYEELEQVRQNPPEPLSWTPPRAAYPLPLPEDPEHDEQNPITAMMRVASEAAQELEVLEVTESIRRKVYHSNANKRRIGDMTKTMADVLDGHKVLLEEKLAALLAALHGHVGITDQFERMAEWISERSDQTRAAIMRERAESDRQEMESRARRQGEGEAISQEAREATSRQRFEQRIKDAIIDNGGKAKLSTLRRVAGIEKMGDEEQQKELLSRITGITVKGDTVRYSMKEDRQ